MNSTAVAGLQRHNFIASQEFMTVEGVAIRPINMPADSTALSAIWFDASLKAHPFIGEGLLREQRTLVEEHYLPNSETWVACESSMPVGFISLLDKFVGAVFVAPDKQGQGIGRALISHALARKGELTLEVYTQNKQALKFYTSLGFCEVSRRPIDDEGMPFENARMVLKA